MYVIRTLLLMICCCGVAFSASSDRKIEAAKKKFEEAVNEANEDYNKEIEKAQASLRKVYDKSIADLKKKDKDAEAEALEAELTALLEEKVEKKAVKPQGHERLIAAIGETVVNTAGKRVATAEILGDKKHVFLYFSAHWCPPCRTFTPKLVDFYKKNGGGQHFEIVFVSSDRSEADMYGYMKEVSMPWVSVPFSQIAASGLKTTYGGRGIPNLVLLDSQGTAISGSYENGQYLGPNKALEDYAQLPR